MPALRLCEDDWMLQLGFDLFDERARELIEKMFWQLTERLLQLGQTVILESGFWLRSERDETRLGARALGAAVELHVLDVPVDELWRRLEERHQSGRRPTRPITREELDRWATFFEAPDAAELELFDPHDPPTY